MTNAKYAVFSGADFATNAKKTEKQMMHVYSRYAGEQRCQNYSTDRSACMQSGFRNLWFGFKVKTGL
jgi:hypothetical protein